MPTTPLIEWHEGQPYSSQFQDIYFSSDHGLHETEYVFLKGNNLSKRWEILEEKFFVIAETGFGTGLNFLCAAKLWLTFAPIDACLHYISTEKYPLSLADLTQSLNLWPELIELSTPLLLGYPDLVQTGTPLMLFQSRIKLSLLTGDATQCLKQLKPDENLVDAWFLDGFAPAKNPDMWQPALFTLMATLSSKYSTFATFTSAGAVRRGLITAGFLVSKPQGFGKKREMLFGSIGAKLEG